VTWQDLVSKKTNKKNQARCQWFPPVIPSTQEAEIGRITVRSQPGKKVQETLSQKNHHEKGLAEWLKV
jgi:hypothetical protein